MNANNIIEFRKKQQVNEEQLSEDIVNDIIDKAASKLFAQLAYAGYVFTELQDFALVIESIRSGMYRSSGDFHPLQIIADELKTVIWTDRDPS